MELRMTHIFLAAAVVALLSVTVAAAWDEDTIHQEFNGAALVRPPKERRAPPDVIVDIYDVVVKLPRLVRVYFDETLFVGTSLVVMADSNTCDYTLEFNMADVEFAECLGNATAKARVTDILITVLLTTVDGDEERYTSPVTYIQKEKVAWPVENEVGVWPPREPNLAGNIMENYQSFSGAPSAYWHSGVDIRSKLRGTVAGRVHSPVDGEVVNFVHYGSGDLYWSLMVEDADGFIWQYHHLDISTVPWEVGDRVSVGDVLGDTAFWPSTWNGEYYHHIHLNVVRPHPSWDSLPLPYVDGWKHYESFDFFDNGDYNSTVLPASDGVIYFLGNDEDVAFAATSDSSVPELSGDVDMIIRLESEYTPPNDTPGQPYPNGLYSVSYEVTPLDVETTEEFQGYLPETLLIRMDKLPNEWSYCLPDYGVAEAEVLLRYIYAQSFVYQGTTHRSIFNYSERVLYYTVTNTFRGEPDGPLGFWDTDELLPSGARRFPDGAYVVTIRASDWYGNEYSVSHEVRVENN